MAFILHLCRFSNHTPASNRVQDSLKANLVPALLFRASALFPPGALPCSSLFALSACNNMPASKKPSSSVLALRQYCHQGQLTSAQSIIIVHLPCICCWGLIADSILLGCFCFNGRTPRFEPISCHGWTSLFNLPCSALLGGRLVFPRCFEQSAYLQ